MVLLWSLVINNKRCITLETAQDLNTIILSSKVNCLMHHNFLFWQYVQKNYLSCTKFLLYEKWTASIFNVLLLRFSTFHATKCHLNLIRPPIPSISHFFLIGFNLEKFLPVLPVWIWTLHENKDQWKENICQFIWSWSVISSWLIMAECIWLCIAQCFSKFKKHLVDFSLCSYQLNLLLIFIPFAFYS